MTERTIPVEMGKVPLRLKRNASGNMQLKETSLESKFD